MSDSLVHSGTLWDGDGEARSSLPSLNAGRLLPQGCAQSSGPGSASQRPGAQVARRGRGQGLRVEVGNCVSAGRPQARLLEGQRGGISGSQASTHPDRGPPAPDHVCGETHSRPRPARRLSHSRTHAHFRAHIHTCVHSQGCTRTLVDSHTHRHSAHSLTNTRKTE